MSHFSVVKTELRNSAMVQAALRRLGIEFEIEGKIEDYYHNVRDVDVLVRLPGQRPVGFARNPDTGVFDVVGDWFGGTLKQADFMDRLTSHYAREQVICTLEEQGIDLSKLKEVEHSDGSVVFELPLGEDEMESLTAGF